jgi:hypothetical protein
LSHWTSTLAQQPRGDYRDRGRSPPASSLSLPP